MKQTKFPAGWDEERVRRLLASYENQSEGETVAEDEAAVGPGERTVMVVPAALVSRVRELIAKQKGAASGN